MDVFTVVKDSFTIVFAMIGSYVAVRGLSTWRRQLRGNYEYELTKRLLKSLYQARDIISQIRSPMIFAQESAVAIKKFADDVEAELREFWKSNNHLGYVYQLRWEKYAELGAEIQSNFYEAEVIWGPEIKPLIKRYQSKIHQLSHSITEYLIFLRNPNDEKLRDKKYMEQIDALKDVVSPMTIKDPYKEDFERLIAEFENILRKHIEMHAPK